MHKFIVDDSHTSYNVYVNLIASPAGRYISRHPHILTILKELFATKSLRGKQIIIEQDMGRDIGTTDVVTTNDKDIVYYAKTVKSPVYSRFVKNRGPMASRVLTISILRDEAGDYEIKDAWIGQNCPAFPGDDEATSDSISFWQTHALLQNTLQIQTETITRTCPYITAEAKS